MNNEVKQNSLKAWLLAARPKTLSGAAVPVLIGIALAYTDISREFGAECFNWVPAVLCLLQRGFLRLYSHQRAWQIL